MEFGILIFQSSADNCHASFHFIKIMKMQTGKPDHIQTKMPTRELAP